MKLPKKSVAITFSMRQDFHSMDRSWVKWFASKIEGKKVCYVNPKTYLIYDFVYVSYQAW